MRVINKDFPVDLTILKESFFELTVDFAMGSKRWYLNKPLGIDSRSIDPAGSVRSRNERVDDDECAESEREKFPHLPIILETREIGKSQKTG